MPSFPVFVCDRCARRHEGHLPPTWCEIHVLEGYNEEIAEPPEVEMDNYVLCDDCAPPAVRQLRNWIGSTSSRSN